MMATSAPSLPTFLQQGDVGAFDKATVHPLTPDLSPRGREEILVFSGVIAAEQ